MPAVTRLQVVKLEILFLVKLEMMNYLMPAATVNCTMVPE